MKTTIFALAVLLTTTISFAQDMSRSESGAYKEMPDGSSRYVGKCKTHEDYQVKNFKVTSLILEEGDTVGYSVAKTKKMIEKIGMPAFKQMMKAFFDDLADFSSDAKLMKDFGEYADDITIETIQLKDAPSMDLLRFNVGYGGGNGGYLVLLKTSSGYKKMSLTGDGDLNYCDLKVWKK